MISQFEYSVLTQSVNRSDSGLVGLFGRDRSDPAAHAKHYLYLVLLIINDL